MKWGLGVERPQCTVEICKVAHEAKRCFLAICRSVNNSKALCCVKNIYNVASTSIYPHLIPCPPTVCTKTCSRLCRKPGNSTDILKQNKANVCRFTLQLGSDVSVHYMGFTNTYDQRAKMRHVMWRSLNNMQSIPTISMKSRPLYHAMAHETPSASPRNQSSERYRKKVATRPPCSQSCTKTSLHKRMNHFSLELGPRFLPGPTTALTKRRLYLRRMAARPRGFFDFSWGATLGV